jgi:hypothetical protein
MYANPTLGNRIIDYLTLAGMHRLLKHEPKL